MKNFNYIANKKISFIVALVLIVAGLASFIIVGFNLGVDFTGGSKITIQLSEKPTDLSKYEEVIVNKVGEKNLVSLINSTANKKTIIATIKSVEPFDNGVKAAISELYGIKAEDIGDVIWSSDGSYASYDFESTKEVKEADLEKALDALYPDAEKGIFKALTAKDGNVVIDYYSVSVEQQIVEEIGKITPVDDEDISTISINRAKAQTKTALIAAFVAIILMLVYITFRFKQISSGLASVICLFFNLFVMFTCYAIFRWEMTLDIIPACLTILGYSINATIVIFDRIRENFTKDKGSFGDAANSGVSSTLLRSINTTITTLITILLVYLLGVESIKAFALPLIIGIIAGLFSSVFLAAPLWSVFRKNKDNKKVA